MCGEPLGFTTVVGSRRVLEELRAGWGRIGAFQRDLPEPELVDYSALRQGWRFTRYADSPAVAVVRHQWTNDPGTAHFVQGAAAAHGLPVVCEPGYLFSLAGSDGGPAAAPGGGRTAPVVVSVDAAVARQAATTAARGAARGGRVAVLDTGRCDVTSPAMIDMLRGQPNEIAPDDRHGHGTAVARIIEAVNPAATLDTIRVVHDDLTSSFELLAALNYALFSESYDVVNASLSADLQGGCTTLLGASMQLLLEVCRQQRTQVPTLVTAAGNTTSGHRFGYPAQLPDAVVVLAWDAGGATAPYNVSVTSHPVRTEWAYGGGTAPSLGHIVHADGTRSELVGTSFAAAVVAGVISS